MGVNFTLCHFRHEGFGLLVHVEQSESESKLKITWTYRTYKGKLPQDLPTQYCLFRHFSFV